MKSRESASAGLSAMFVGGQRSCCRFCPPNVVSISLNCAIRETGPMICTQPPFIPGSTRFSSLKESSPFSWFQSAPDCGSIAIPKLFRWPYEKILWRPAPTSPPIAAPAA